MFAKTNFMKDRFIIQQSELQEKSWVCTDTENLIVCTFEEKQFNETQQFTFVEEVKNPNANQIAKALREMADWLRANHYSKAMP